MTRPGWTWRTSQPAIAGVQPSYPGLEDLQAAAMTVVRTRSGTAARYGTTCAASSPSGSAACGSAPPAVLDGGHPLDFGELLDANVVLEIEDAAMTTTRRS